MICQRCGNTLHCVGLMKLACMYEDCYKFRYILSLRELGYA